MKVFSINYQPIVNDRCGNALIHYLFKTFCQLDDQHVFLTSSIDRYYGNNIIGHSRLLAKILTFLVILAKKCNVPSYLTRSWSEIIVDYQHFLFLRKQAPPYVLITTMYSRRCTKLAKQKGCRTILIAGNLNDELYYNAVKKEQKRLGLKYTDIYSSRYRINIYKTMLSRIDEVWVNSNIAARTFDDKITRVIPMSYYESRGYSPKSYHNTKNDQIIIGYFGHTTLLKGVHLLAEAISKSRYKDKIKLVLAGSIDKYVAHLLTQIDVDVVYLGYVKEEEKESIIKSFDIMAIPSLYDAGPTTIYEGCECNVPLLVSSGCGGSELIAQNKGCLIFQTMDVSDLANKIDDFYENHKTYESAGSYMYKLFGESNDNSNIELLKQTICKL